MEKIKLIIKGFIIGVGKIIPGVSGGLLAIALGVYEPAIQAISHFFSNWKRNLMLLCCLGIGGVLAVVGMSGIIEISLERYYLPTMLLFIGFMLGGFPSVKKEVKGSNWKRYLPHLCIPFFIMMSLNLITKDSLFVFDKSIQSYLLLFLFGVIDAITMIVPGVSGTAILMLLGSYPVLLNAMSHLFDFSMLGTTLNILFPFSLGIIIGAIVTIKLVSYFLEKHSISFYYVFISFFISSTLLLFIQTMGQNYSVFTIIIGIICFIIGYLCSKYLDQHYNL